MSPTRAAPSTPVLPQYCPGAAGRAFPSEVKKWGGPSCWLSGPLPSPCLRRLQSEHGGQRRTLSQPMSTDFTLRVEEEAEEAGASQDGCTTWWGWQGQERSPRLTATRAPDGAGGQKVPQVPRLCGNHSLHQRSLRVALSVLRS